MSEKSDLISREALLDYIDSTSEIKDWCLNRYSADWIYSFVKSAPSVDAAPVVHGSPVYHNRPARYEHYEMVQQTENGEPLYKRQYYTLQDNPVAYCSECGKRMCSRFTSFCSHCGAKMDGRGEADA